ncbi:cytochrome P450 [Kitasatospora sp. NPDC008115]|uniref:cytochrome P450 n=1 Tax=Kitasatospora sp. NPDC008115 TaxID=3364022 RepID=UPI0036ECC5D8
MTDAPAPIPFPFPEGDGICQPIRELDELRTTHPVAQVTLPDGTPAWLLTRHADVRQALFDPVFSNRVMPAMPNMPQNEVTAIMNESLVGMDPPEHTRLRKLVSRAFTVKRIDALRPRITELVDELITAMQAMPQPVNMVEAFSVPFPVQVICELLGVPRTDEHDFREWADTLLGDWMTDPVKRDEAALRFREYFTALISAKRTDPGDDLITALIAASDEGDKLTEREIVHLCVGMLINGYETTANAIGMFLLVLRRHPEDFARLIADPTGVPAAVEELLRFVQTGTSGTGQPKITKREVVLSGVTIPAGALILPGTGAANRDPEVFTDPDRLDLTRAENPHLALGGGLHHCLGAQLARVELQEALLGVIRRMPNVEIAVPESELRMKPFSALRGLQELPITW